MDDVEDDPRSRYMDYSCVTPLEQVSSDLEVVLREWRVGTMLREHDSRSTKMGVSCSRRRDRYKQASVYLCGGSEYEQEEEEASRGLELILQFFIAGDNDEADDFRPSTDSSSGSSGKTKLRNRKKEGVATSDSEASYQSHSSTFLSSPSQDDTALLWRWRSEKVPFASIHPLSSSPMLAPSAPSDTSSALCEWFGLRHCLVPRTNKRTRI